MSIPIDAEKEAEEWKEMGNEEYRAGRFSSAVDHYTHAISLRDDEPTYFQNRAAAYFGLAQYDSSLADCERALALDRTFLKAVVRGAKCLSKLGRVDEAVARLLSVSLEDPLVEAVRLKTEGNAAWKAEEYEAAAELYTQALHVLGDVDADERAKILCNRAGSYHKLGRFKEALADATAAVALDSSYAKAHMRCAMALEGLGRHDAGRQKGYDEAVALAVRAESLLSGNRFREAIPCFEQCVAIFRALGRREEEAVTVSNLGIALISLGQFRKAIECHERDLAISREVGDPAGEGRACGNLGIANEKCGQFQKAIEYYKMHLAISRTHNDLAGEGRAFGNLGNACLSLGQFPRAIEYFKKVLAIARMHGNRAVEGMTYGNLGNAYCALGQYQKAIEHYEKRLAIARELGDRVGEGKVYGNLGNAYQSLGQFQKAIEYHEKDLAIARGVGDRAGEGRAYACLGCAYNSLGQYRKAIECHKRSLAISREIGDRAGEGKTYANLGNVYELLGLLQQSIEYHEKDLSIAREIGDRAGEGRPFGNLGNIYHALGEHQKAIEYHEKRLAIAREVGDRAGEGTAHCNMGNVYHSLDQYQQAVVHQEQHLAIAREVGDRAGEGMALHNAGLTLLVDGVRFAANSADCRTGNTDRAIDVLSEAIELRESLWNDLGADETSKITLLESLGKTYRVLQEAQVKAGQHESALETAERGRARTLVDRLSRSDATFPSEPLNASAMRSLAESCGTVVVVYSVVKEEVFTWVITPDAISFDRLLPARPLEDMAADVANVIDPEKFESSSTSVLTELYDLLIRPIVDLSDVDVITFIPQGPLLFVPFTALHDSETNLDLIDRCVVSISPCVAVLNRAPLLETENRGLAIGNPQPVIGPGLLPLHDAEAAVRIIGHILGLAADSVLIGEQATRQAVVDGLGRSPFHAVFVTHGEAPQTHVALARDEDEASMVLSGSERVGERDVAGIDLRSTALVDLSACWLARGKTSVEGALNLSRACIVGGAQSVIGALTSVFEYSTSLLMIRFYHRLLEHTDGRWRAARALRDAQRWLRDSTTAEIDEFLDLYASHESIVHRLRPSTTLAAAPSGSVQGAEETVPPVLVLGVGFSSMLSRPKKWHEAAVFWAPFQVIGGF